MLLLKSFFLKCCLHKDEKKGKDNLKIIENKPNKGPRVNVECVSIYNI